MIAIVSYQATWEAEFMRLGRHLRQNLGDLALRIDHIGSTTIPGLAAKDIIDIQITARALTLTLESALNLAGYHRVSHITQDHLPPGKNEQVQEWLKWFFTPSSAQRPINVHIRMPGRANQRYALLFRDYVGNRKNGRAQWDYVTGLKPDIVLLQECRPPSHYLDQAQLHQRAPYFLWESIDGVSRPKGVCVYTNGLPIQ